MIKSEQEIAHLREGGKRLSQVLRELCQVCSIGVSTASLDALARERMRKFGGKPAFLGYRIHDCGASFPGAVCISINEEVVHGLPIPDRQIVEGDIVSLDLGMWFEGLVTDMAMTVMVGAVDLRTRRLVEDTKASLVRGIEMIHPDGHVGDIGVAIESYLRPLGYGIVHDLVGHGVGHALHEEPQIPNVRDRRALQIPLRPGMVLAIEPMVTLGSPEVMMLPDGWTIVTADGSIAAHAELTVAVTEVGYELVTPWPDDVQLS